MKNHKQKLFLYILTGILLFNVHSFGQQYKSSPNLTYFDDEWFHYGYLLGINQSFFTIKLQPDVLDNTTINGLPLRSVEAIPSLGFNIGFVGNLRLAEHFDLRLTPTLTFASKNIQYNFDTESETKNVISTLVEFPLLVKFKGDRLHNLRPYIFTGGKYSYDLSGILRKQKKDEIKITLKPNDLAALGGVGFDFYTPYFKFAVEASMSYGFLDILKHEEGPYAAPLKKLSSKVFQLSITFE